MATQSWLSRCTTSWGRAHIQKKMPSSKCFVTSSWAIPTWSLRGTKARVWASSMRLLSPGPSNRKKENWRLMRGSRVLIYIKAWSRKSNSTMKGLLRVSTSHTTHSSIGYASRRASLTAPGLGMIDSKGQEFLNLSCRRQSMKLTTWVNWTRILFSIFHRRFAIFPWWNLTLLRQLGP